MARMEIRAHDLDVRKYLLFRTTKDPMTTFRVRPDEKLRNGVMDNLTNKAQGM